MQTKWPKIIEHKLFYILIRQAKNQLVKLGYTNE